ncbi:MAG: hypothetical protein IJR14_02135, partial [Synergistaceae bacterium]|nr:hypothetical protein [Synergistaceae bacterium]
NPKRYYHLLKNGFTSDAVGDFAARLMKGMAFKSPLYAYRAAKTVLMVNLLGWAIQAFNHFVMGDDEEELTPDVRDRPHLTLGHDGDGRVYYFDRVGAIGDLLDWFAMDSFWPDMREILNGQQTVTGYLKKMAQAPISKAVNALNPLLKTPAELLSGRSVFPDAFHPRAIRDVGTYVASTLGLSWEYRALTGQPGPKYFSMDRALGLFTYSQDKGEAAYFYINDKKREFQERVLGKSFDGFATSKRGNALRRLKTSLRFNDEANIKRSLQQYYEAGGTKQGLKAILGRPLTEDAAPGEASAPEYEEFRMTQDEYARIVEEAPDLAERVRDDARKGTDGRTNNEIRRMLERQTRKDPLWNEQETKDIQARIEQEMAAAGRPEAEAKDLARMAMAFAIATHRRVGGAIPLARIVDVHILGRGKQEAGEASPVGGAGQETASAPGDMARAQRAEAEIYAQNEDGTWHLSFSSDRYSLASGGSLESAASGDHILKDGGIAWGRVTEELSDGRADVPVGDIRVPVGNENMGLVHAKGHEGQFAAKGFADAEGFIEHTLGSFNTIVPVGDGKHFIAYDQGMDTSPAAVLAWRQDGGYYDLLTAYPAKRKTMNRIKKKSSSLRGAASSAQAPALAPSLDSAAAQSPESDAAVPYGNDDADIIAAIEGDVNRGGSVQTAEETAREMGYGQDEGLLQLAVAALGKVKDKVESYAQNMWHGSRHILEGMKFLLSKIGTGEGAQAYGWGVYLAQLRRVSETYMMAGAHGEDRTKSAIGRTRSYEIWRDRDTGSWRTHGGMFADEYRYPGLRAVLDAIVDEPSPALSPMQRMAQFIEEKETELAELEAKKAEQWAVYDALFKARSEEMTGQEQEALEEAYLAYCDAVTSLEVVARTLDLAKEIEPDSLKHLSYGNLYRVEGPEDDVLLDYDAPMAE